MKQLTILLVFFCAAAHGLTADQFICLDSKTNAVDLSTSEVAGILPASSVGIGLTDTQVQNALTISGGTVDNTPVGFTTPSTGAFTTGSFTGLLSTVASTTAGAGIIIPPGMAPTSPNNGNLWTTALGLYCQIAGATVGPYMSASSTTDFGLNDNINLELGTDGDFQFRFNTTALQLRDAAGNSLGTWTDSGTTGDWAATGNLTAGGDLYVNGGDIITDDTTVNVLNATATKLKVGGVAAIDLSGTGLMTTVKGTLNVDQAVTFDTTFAATGDVTLTGDIAVNGADVTSTATTVQLFDTTTTKINLGGAAAVDIGCTALDTSIKGTLGVAENATFTGDIAVNGADVTSTAATVNLFNATTTKLNVGGAAAVDLGKTALTTTVKGLLKVNEATTIDTTLAVTGNTTLTGDIAVNGADVTSTAATVQLFDTTTTKINLGGAAALDVGCTGLDTAVKGTLSVAEAATFTSTMGVTGYKWSASGGDIVWTDGTNTMLTLSDEGTTGNLTATGTITGVAGTFTGLVITPASTTTNSGLRLPHGTAPTAPTNGDLWSTTAGFYGYANSATVGPFISTASLTRANLTQQDLQVYPVPITMCRVWDNLASLLPTTAATDDLGIIEGTWLTNDAAIQTSDGKATTTTQRLRFQYPLPVEYVAGQTVTLRINSGMVTTVSDSSATLDAEVIEVGAPTVDINATALQSINSLAAADFDFTITPTNLVPGDVLDVRLTIVIVDGATGTAVIGQINSIDLLLDVKG